MNPAEVVKILAKASAYDQRTVGRADVMAWHEVLDDIEADDGLNAVAQHYAEHTERLMPAHIRRLALAALRDRKRRKREQREQAAIEAERADPSRRNRSKTVSEIINELRAMLPDGHPDKLRRPEWIAWERAQIRAAARRRLVESAPGCECSRGYILSLDGAEIVNCPRCNPRQEAL